MRARVEAQTRAPVFVPAVAEPPEEHVEFGLVGRGPDHDALRECVVTDAPSDADADLVAVGQILEGRNFERSGAGGATGAPGTPLRTTRNRGTPPNDDRAAETSAVVRRVAYRAYKHDMATQRQIPRHPCSVRVLIVTGETHLERPRPRDGEVTGRRVV